MGSGVCGLRRVECSWEEMEENLKKKSTEIMKE